MKKLLALTLALLMLATVFAGCTASAPAESEAPAAESTEAAAPAESTEAAQPAPETEEAEAAAEPEVDAEETEVREISYMESLGYISDYEAAKLAESLGIQATNDYFPLEETKKITATHVYAPFVINNLPTGDMNEKLVFAEYEKRTNVHVDWTAISMMSASEDYQLLIAAGDWPDLMFNYGGYVSNASYEGAVDDEILLDLTDIIVDYCPNYNYMLTNNKDIRLGASTSKGYIPEFIGLDVGVDIYNADYIRQDWLDALGLDLPETYDQLHDVLVQFRDEYDCTCPMWIPDNGVDDKLMLGFGVTNGWYLDESGEELIYGFVQEGYRDYLKLMRDWYNEGLFSVEFMAMNNDFDATPSDLINNGKCGVFFQKFDSLANFDTESSGDPNFAVTPIGSMVKNPGDVIEIVDTAAKTFSYGQGWAMTADVDDLELVARWCDFWYSEDNSMLANYGTEGYTFEYNDEGKPMWTDVIINNPDMNFQPAVATMLLYKGGGYVSDSWKELQAYSDELIEADLAARANQVGGRALPSGMEMTGEEETEAALYNTDIETAVEENTLRFITGESDIDDDAAWETYVNTVESLGLQNVHDIQVQVYERYLAS